MPGSSLLLRPSSCPTRKAFQANGKSERQPFTATPASSLHRSHRQPHGSAALHTPPPPRLASLQARSGGLGDDDVDVAIFRFTLGIPGFDDRLIPRFVGYIGGALLGINHVLGNPAAAQERAELLGATMAATLVIAPWIEERLLEIQPGRGRSALGEVEGATNAFHLSPALPDEKKKELAWASFALLKNTNCCSVLVLGVRSQALLARGAVASTLAGGSADKALGAVSKEVGDSRGTSQELASVLAGMTQQLYLNDRASLAQAGLASCGCIPTGIQNAVVQAVPGAPGAALLVLSERAGGLSEKDRSWIAALAGKLGPVVS